MKLYVVFQNGASLRAIAIMQTSAREIEKKEAKISFFNYSIFCMDE